MSRKVNLRTRAMVANWLGACRRLTNREHPQKRRAYRWTFAIVAMAVGAVIGGSFLRADVPQVATGSWMEMQSGPFGDALPGAASAVLPDGKVVVAGGQLADGSFTGAVVLYDPALGEWKSAGTLIEPRAGLSAAALADGHVVFAGGRTAAGMAASVEVFDPQAGSSQLAGEMMLRRADAAAATLPDGRVLIAGGTDGAGPLAAAELFNPVTGTSQFAASLAVARAGLSATTLLDGHVLVAGGNDGHNDVAMAEIYDPELGFFWETESMNTPRSRHVAMRLPGSNTVLVAGGMSNGVALKSAEQYAHWGQLWLAYEPLMSVARVGAIAAPTSRPGVVLIGGGGNPSGEYYGYATVGTDKDDYAPYETVTISGSGWQPGETVHLRVSEDSDSHYDWELEAIADEFGKIVNQDFYPRQDEFFQHIGMRFYLSASGIASQAQTTFTDAGSIALNPSIAAVGTSVTVSSGGGAFGGDKNNIAIYWDGGSTPLTTCSTSHGGNIQGTCAFSVPASTPGPHSVTATQQDAPALTFSATLIVGAANGDGTMVVNPSSVTAGSSGNNFTFTFTASAAFDTGSQASITIPSGWTAPTTGNTVLATASTCTGLSRSVSTNTIIVNMSCAAGQSVTLTYNGITAPATPGPHTFTTKTRQSSTGTLTTIASSPVVTVIPACSSTSVTTQPSNQSVTYGGDATFTAAANGNPAPTVQWQVSTDGVSFTNLATQTNTTLTLTKPTVSQSGNKYRAVFTNTCGGPQTATSAAATLTVAAHSVTGSFTTANKFYDTTTTATITGRSLNGAIAGDDVSLSGGSATFSDKNVANGKTVTGTGFVLAGSAASNYSLVSSTLTTTADIKALAVTVIADAKSKTYGDGDPVLTYTATLQGTDSFTGTLTRDLGENVGTYAIKQGTLSAGTNYTVTFVPANLTISARPVTVAAEAKSKTYGDADPALTYTGALHGTDAFTGSLARAIGEDVGSYAISQGTLSAGSNYALTFVGASLTISARPVTVTAEAKSKTYGDADPALTYTGALHGTDTFTGSLARVSGEDVGSYAIGQGTLSAGSNYALTFVGANLTITARPVTVTAEAKSKTYGDADPALTYTGALHGTDAFTGSLARAIGEDVGSYAISQGTLSAGSNYALTFVGASLTISARPVTVTAEAKSKTYGDADPALTYTGALHGTDTFTGSLARVSGEDVGSYAIGQGTLSAGSNYALTFVGANLTITARPVTVTAEAKSKTYGDADPALTYTGALHGTDAFTGSLARVIGEDVGSYAISQGTLSAGSNYALTFVGANLTITARPVTVTAEAKSKTYGDADPALTYTGALHGTDAFTGSLARVSGEDVGSYAIGQGTLSAGSNYTLTFVGANLTITARPVTVTAEAKSKTYGDADPALTYTGALHGTDAFTGSLARVSGEDVGSYAIGQGTLSAGSNYTLTFVPANLTISARPVTVTAEAKNKTYGDADPALTYTGALQGTDTFTGSLARAIGEDVGSYAINQGTLNAGGNYMLTFVGATLTISARPVTVTAEAKNKTYGDADPTLTYQITTGALVTGDAFSGSLTRVAGETVGDYAIQQGTLGLSGNYTLTFNGTNLTITKRPVTVTAEAKSKTYGDGDPVLTFTGALYGTDTFTGALVRDAGENVGSYAINQGTLNAGGNYTLTFVPANLTISARPVTVTGEAKSKTYGDADPALTYTGALQGTDAFTGSLARVSGEDVGGYAINQGSLSAGSNYTLTFVPANLTITARPVIVTAEAKSKTYGDGDPALTYTGTLHGSDGFTGSLARVSGEDVGSYAINQGSLSAGSNYALTFVGANLTIKRATLMVAADNKSRPYGDTNPTLTASFTGFKFSQSLATGGVTGAPALATPATQSSPIGPYAITAALGTLASGNYTFELVNGTLTVDKAPLEIRANNASRPYSVANPTFSGGYYGQKNGDTFTMSFSTSATINSGVGLYPIVPEANGATLGNYAVTTTNGTLTVGAWSLKGFYEPVGEMNSIRSAPGVIPAVSTTTVWNSIKGGQTVPMKFNIYRGVGGAQVTTVADAFSGAGFSAFQLPNCSGGYTDDEIPLSDLSTGGTDLRWDGTQFIQNWKTPKVSGADLCYRAVITAKDGSTITAFFKVKK